MQLTHRIDGSEEYLELPLAKVDVPALSIIRARNGEDRIYLELTGDVENVLDFN
jgi:hypothetical protein